MSGIMQSRSLPCKFQAVDRFARAEAEIEFCDEVSD